MAFAPRDHRTLAQRSIERQNERIFLFPKFYPNGKFLGLLGDGMKRSLAPAKVRRFQLKEEKAGSRFDSSGHYRDALRQCQDLESVRQIHDRISGAASANVFLGNEIVRAYGKCGSVASARAAFDAIARKNDYSWGSMLTAYAQNGHYRAALDLYKRMDLQPNPVVYTTVLGACASIKALEEGKAIHSRISGTKGLKLDVILENSLLTMYAKCGSLEDAKRLFERMSGRSVSSWNAMIAAYAQSGHFEEAIRLYEDMDVEPSVRTFTSVLSACSNLGLLDQGRKIHALISSRGTELDLSLQNALLTMYARCKCLDDAAKIFQRLPRRDVVSWSAMIAAFAETDLFDEAIEFYSKMQLEGVRPNYYTFASVLLACASVGDLRAGRAVHDQILGNGYKITLVNGTALVDLYTSYGSLDEARSLFDQIENRDEGLWTVLIGGYSKQGHRTGVLELYREMKNTTKVPATKIIYSCVISACASLGAFADARQAHSDIEADGMISDFVLATSLVNMYSRWGNLESARQVFDKMSSRDTLAWTTLIAGYAKHGEHGLALGLYKEMELEGAEPSELTFMVVLYACSHAGLQEQGKQLFISIQSDYAMHPNIAHYSCIIDLLSRAGRLSDAEELINAMPVEPNDVTWSSLLGASRIHKDVKRATHAAGQITKLDPVDPASYVLLSNVHAVTGNLAGMASVRNTMVARGVKKRRGSSWIEVADQIHEFNVGDNSHPRFQEIFAELQRLSPKIKEAGYVPESEEVLHDVGEKEKELLLRLHSEKLAIAFGLIATAPGTTLRIFNTLRICHDCHSAVKFISAIARREIIVRDSSRFHKFRDGQCSCGDYW
ncbi:pentatricopeptide repeat-containing protein At3g12770 [Selaginella moellendorffii]|nr:pentatricopeptide repeat-containing protein At3g12770 [Selaginella moellendorffii]|eukprot:XP_002964616.2 pentatricopeptide repeat-containing protein At3g12770 [Selaginella moellendorffii]